MAKSEFDFIFPDELVNMFERVANDDTLAEKIFDGVGEIIEEKMKQECHKHDNAGELANSINASNVYTGKDGMKTVYVRPTGYSKHTFNRVNGSGHIRKYPVHNGFKLVELEYGNSHQPPRPMLDRIKREVNDKVVSKMQENLNKEVGD